MERTSKTPEDCDRLLNDLSYTNDKLETQNQFSSSKINSAFNNNFSDEDDDEIILRHSTGKTDTNLTSCRRYAEVHSYPGTSLGLTRRWSDLKLEPFTAAQDDITELGDDERQSLIPPEKLNISADELDQSRDSFMSNSDAGVLAGDEHTSSDSDNSDGSSRICDISVIERLLRTHSLWFLPGIQRSGAVHLLQGKEEGNFIVRGSSQHNTMAISVRLPPNVGPYIEHYLIISHNGVLSLENSREKFDSIPALIAHYSSVCEELPVQLCLPKALREIFNRQQLSSLALLGQEFWRCSIASNGQAKSPVDTSSGIGLTMNSPNSDNTFAQLDSKQINESSCLSPMSDTISTMSSFSLNNNSTHLTSPISPANSFCTDTNSGIIGKTSTFKVLPQKLLNDTTSLDREMGRHSTASSECSRSSQSGNHNNVLDLANRQRQRPTPPNTLNLNMPKSPPTPPPRWSKILMTPPDSNNFTLTFTFSTRPESAPTNPFPCDTKRLSPEGQCNTFKDNSNVNPASYAENKTLNDKEAHNTTNKRNKRKESKHYQESDILLESQFAYCRSGLSEKQSDYEDIWTQNDTINSPIGRTMSSFRSSNKVDLDSNPVSSLRKTSHLILTPIDIPLTNTNPFITNKLHQSSNNLSSTETEHQQANKVNRFSLDLSNNMFSNLNKDWSPFYADPADALLEEPIRRTNLDDSVRIAHAEGKRHAIALDPWMTDNHITECLNHSNGSASTCAQVQSLRTSDLLLHKLIMAKYPDVNLSDIIYQFPSDTSSNKDYASDKSRQSKYDNVDACRNSDTTEFSEPWSAWEPFYQMADNCSTLTKQSEKSQRTATITRNRNRDNKEILYHPQNRNAMIISPEDSVGAYVMELSKDQSSTFSQNIENFIACTKESLTASPQVIMRNMRQFMNGMKNYLVKHGEADFQREVKAACSRLPKDKYLDIDTILEDVMQKLVVIPLRDHLYKRLVDNYLDTVNLNLLLNNMRIARERGLAELGVEDSRIKSPEDFVQITTLLYRMQEAALPIEKWELYASLLKIIEKCSPTNCMGADNFLPLLIHVIAKAGFIGAEIEAEYVLNLIHPKLVSSGEIGYYMTSLCSAIVTLKDLRTIVTISAMKVYIPDEHGSLETEILPIRRSTVVRDACRTLAHKSKITNSQDYGLFKLSNGEETLLQDHEFPEEIIINTQSKCVFVYKRIDAKIAMPCTIWQNESST